MFVLFSVASTIAFFIKTALSDCAIMPHNGGDILNPNQEAIKKVIDYIEKHLDEEMELDNIARHAGYSKFHLNRIFTEETGTTIHKYLQLRRLTIAAEKLAKTDIPVAQIAYEAGYHSQQAFSLAFKKIYLYPPKLYRNMGLFAPKQNRMEMAA